MIVSEDIPILKASVVTSDQVQPSHHMSYESRCNKFMHVWPFEQQPVDASPNHKHKALVNKLFRALCFISLRASCEQLSLQLISYVLSTVGGVSGKPVCCALTTGTDKPQDSLHRHLLASSATVDHAGDSSGNCRHTRWVQLDGEIANFSQVCLFHVG